MAYYPPTHEARSPAAPVANCSNKQLKFDHSYSKRSSTWTRTRSRSDLVQRKKFNALILVSDIKIGGSNALSLLPIFDFQIHDIGVRGGIQGRELFGDTSKQERWLSTL